MAATTVALLALGSAPAAMAAPRTHVAWQLPAANAGSPTSFSWSSSHLLPGSVVVVQRPVGTARVWRTVLRLSGTRGTASLPAYPLGRYRLRLAVVAGPRVLAQQQRVLHVFGKVPFSVLFGPDLEKGVYATPTASFPYIFKFDNLVNGSAHGVVSVEHNDCESVTVEFVAGNDGATGYSASSYAGDLGTVSVVQQTRDPVSASAPFQGENSFTASVVPGQSWSINLSESGPEGDQFVFYFYLNGYAVCDSAAGLAL